MTDLKQAEQQAEMLPTIPSIWNEPVPAGYRRDRGGNLVRVENIKPRDQKMDDVVNKIFSFGLPLRDQIGRFRGYSEMDINEFVEYVINDLGGKVGGKKGNLQLESFDGCRMVRVAQGNFLSVGPEIVAVQSMINEMLNRLGKGAPRVFRDLVDAVLRPRDKEVAVHKLLGLAHAQLDDEQWPAIQQAIREAVKVRGTAEYLRLYERENPDKPWRQLALNLSTVEVPTDLRHGGDDPVGLLHLLVSEAVSQAQRAGVRKSDINRAIAAARRGEPLENPDAADA